MKRKFLIGFVLFVQVAAAFAQREYNDIITNLLTQKKELDTYVKLVFESDKAKKPLTGAQLFELNQAISEHLDIRNEANAYFEPSRHMFNEEWLKEKILTQSELAQMTKSLAVEMTLFEMDLYFHYVFQQSTRLRRIFNEEDQTYGRKRDLFSESGNNAFTMKTRDLLRRGLKVYNDSVLSFPELVEDKSLAFAHTMIQNSFHYNEVPEEYFIKVGPVFKGKLDNTLNHQADIANAIANKVVYGGSKFFGNTVGEVQTRRGKLYRRPEFIETVKRTLRPLDILLEKTPFRLTDKFIPGYWGHAAIYIGTVNDLKELGIWNHPLVEKYKYFITQDRLIVEALRNDVQINSIVSFSDIDDFAVLRLKKPLTPQEQVEHILRALSQIGKHYDFSFDVETGKTIVCSELHYRTFIGIDFNTSRILGRNTISVDQVAEQATTGHQLEPVMLYLDGQSILPEMIQREFDNQIPELLQPFE